MDETKFPSSPMPSSEFAWLLLWSNHANPEIQALLVAWKGTIEFERPLNPSVADSAMSANAFTTLLLGMPRDAPRDLNAPAELQPAVRKSIDAGDLEQFLGDASYREGVGPEARAGMVERLIVAYGRGSDEQREIHLPEISAEYIASSAGQQRQTMLNHLMGRVEARETGARALLPFLMMDPDRAVASTAALGISILSNLDGDYISDGFRSIVEAWDKSSFKNRGAVLGGVLLLGDARFLKHFTTRRPSLSVHEVNEMAKCQSSFMLSQTIDFYLNWAEELVDIDRRDNDGLGKFGAVMSALVLVTRSVRGDDVVDEERAIHVWSKPEPIRILQRWSRKEFSQRISPRFYALEARDDEPKLVPSVRLAWHIEGRPSLLKRLSGKFVPTSRKH